MYAAGEYKAGAGNHQLEGERASSFDIDLI